MPMIDVYAAAGTFPDRHTLAQNPRTQSSPLLPRFLILDTASCSLSESQSPSSPAAFIGPMGPIAPISPTSSPTATPLATPSPAPPPCRGRGEESLAGLRLTGYFLGHWLLEPHGKKLPAARTRLVQMMKEMHGQAQTTAA